MNRKLNLFVTKSLYMVDFHTGAALQQRRCLRRTLRESSRERRVGGGAGAAAAARLAAATGEGARASDRRLAEDEASVS